MGDGHWRAQLWYCYWQVENNNNNNNNNETKLIILGSHLTIEFSGCNPEYPTTSNFPAMSCYDQSSGGYGDGIGKLLPFPPTRPDCLLINNLFAGTYSPSYMNFQCDYCAGWFNTQDAFDFGHNAIGNITFTNSIAYISLRNPSPPSPSPSLPLSLSPSLPLSLSPSLPLSLSPSLPLSLSPSLPLSLSLLLASSDASIMNQMIFDVKLR